MLLVIRMNTYDAILSRRTIRRYKQTPLSKELVKRLVNAGRVAPSAANLQPLEYVVVIEEELRSKIFSSLAWAAYLKPPWSPAEYERPTAYIVILVNEEINADYKRDVGLAAENIMLAAEDEEIGSCMFLNVNRKKVREILYIPKGKIIDSVIALGYKAETSVVEELKDSVKYWRDGRQVLHVPKRKLEDVVHIDTY